VGVVGNVFHCRLAVLRRVTDVLRVRSFDHRKLLAQGIDHVLGLVQAQRGLSDVRHARWIWYFEVRHFLSAADHLSHIWSFTQGTDHLVVVMMADKNNAVATLGILHSFHMDLGHKRAGSVNYFQIAQLAGFTHAGSHAMRRVDQTLAVRDLIDFVHKYRAFGLEFLDHVAVVHNFFAHVDRRPKRVQGDTHDVDGPDHTRAETT